MKYVPQAKRNELNYLQSLKINPNPKQKETFYKYILKKVKRVGMKRRVSNAI